MRNTLIFFLISLLIIGCKDETTTTSTIHDPSKPVQITGFEPTEGGARTRLYIQGNNFGSNTDDIKVKIGGLPAKVIGSNGNIIYGRWKQVWRDKYQSTGFKKEGSLNIIDQRTG